jgi:hypothetical protein
VKTTVSPVTPIALSGAPLHSGERILAWLPVPAVEIDGLPGCLDYSHWDGLGGYQTHSARVTFYTTPIAKGADVTLRPLPHMSRLRVFQALRP